ncbi:hypothetical protein D3C81_1322610 [compost metagenome]
MHISCRPPFKRGIVQVPVQLYVPLFQGGNTRCIKPQPHIGCVLQIHRHNDSPPLLVQVVTLADRILPQVIAQLQRIAVFEQPGQFHRMDKLGL